MTTYAAATIGAANGAASGATSGATTSTTPSLPSVIDVNHPYYLHNSDNPGTALVTQ